MELRQLAHFVAVAEEGSFTRAAKRANIVQSGISASIAALERELGAVLFLRAKRHVELTDPGRAFLTEARRALSAATAARLAVMSAATADGQFVGSVTIGMIQTLPHDLGLVDALARFHRLHPAVEVKVREVQSPMFEALQDGELDLMIGAGQGPPGITSQLIGRYPMVLACAETHPLANRRSVSLRALADEPLIVTPRTWIARRIMDRALVDAGIAAHIAFEVNHVPIILQLVQERVGVAILPDIVTQFSAAVRFVPLRPTIGSWEISVSFSGLEPRTPVIRELAQLLTTRRDVLVS